MKAAVLVLALALPGLAVGVGCAARAIQPDLRGTDIGPESGMLVAVKAVVLPASHPRSKGPPGGTARPAAKADSAAVMTGIFGGLIGGMPASGKAASETNGEELHILMDRTNETIVVVQERGEATLATGDRVIVQRDGEGNAAGVEVATGGNVTVVRAPSR